MVIDAESTAGYSGNFNCWHGPVPVRLGQRDLRTESDLHHVLGEREESLLADAGFVDGASGDFRLSVSSPCRGRGHLQRTIGPQWMLAPRMEPVAAIEDARVHAVNAATATITWWTPRHPGYSLVRWQAVGAAQAGTQESEFGRSIFHAICLQGLQPDTEYEVKPGVRHAAQAWTEHTLRGWAQGDADKADEQTWGPVIRFRTPAADPPPRTLHVSVDGDDGRDGLTAATAWRSLRQACREARPGDTVLVGPGRYRETLAPLNTGVSDERRITFRATQPRTAILDGNQHRIPWAVKLVNRDYITVDGFHIERQSGNDYSMAQSGAYSAQVLLSNSRFCTVTRCYLDGGKEFPNGSWAGVMGVWVVEAEGALIDDNFLVKQTWSITSAIGRETDERFVWPLIRNNTFLYTYIWAVHMIGPKDRLKLRNNLFAERVRAKAGLAYIRIWDARSRIDSDYNFFYWNHDKPRDMSRCHVIMWHNVLPDTEPSLPGGLAAWQKVAGQDRHSLEAFFPTNNIYDHLDFNVAGKPYQGRGENGADIGCSWIGKHTDQIVFEEGTPTVDVPPWRTELRPAPPRSGS
jgi:hypothetical protein